MRNHFSDTKSYILPLSLFLTVAGLQSGAAADWPQWQGPVRDGICSESGLLQDWPAEGPRLAWKATGLGEGYAGVAVVGNRIYTMGDGADGCYARRLDAGTGKIVWSTRVGKPGGGGGYPGPRCTPSIDGNLMVVLGQEGDLVCMEAESGKILWQHNLKSELGGKMMSGWGYAESPLVDGNLVICSPGGGQGTLAAFDKQTGKLAWRSTEWTDKASYSSAIVATIGGVRQYIQLTDASVAGVAATDGKLLWRASRVGKVATIPTPIYSDGYVYVTSGYGDGCNLFKVTESGGKFSATEVYANKNMVDHHGGVIKIGDYVYGHSESKGWVCQDFKSGEVKWQNKEKLGKGSIGYADGRFYLRQEGGPGTVVLIEASPEGFKEHGRFKQPERSNKNSWPHPVIAGGKLYLRDQDVLLCYEVAQGSAK